MSAVPGTASHFHVKMRQPQHTRGDGVENIPPNTDQRHSTRSDNTDTQHTLTSVSRLKHVFQQDADSGPINIPRTKGRAFADVRSPDIKRKRDTQSPDGQETAKVQRNPNPGVIDPKSVDPQKYFEATNHVQRFHHTRAIFAQMEEKSRRDKERGPKSGSTRRGASPVRTQVSSPSPPLVSPMSPDDYRKSAPVVRDNAAKHRSVSEPGLRKVRTRVSSGDDTNGASQHRQQHQENRDRQRIGSVDNLDDKRLYTAPNSRLRVDRDTISRSETDLSQDHDVKMVESTVPSPKWLIKKYETETKKVGPASRAAPPPTQSAVVPRQQAYIKPSSRPTSLVDSDKDIDRSSVSSISSNTAPPVSSSYVTSSTDSPSASVTISSKTQNDDNTEPLPNDNTYNQSKFIRSSSGDHSISAPAQPSGNHSGTRYSRDTNTSYSSTSRNVARPNRLSASEDTDPAVKTAIDSVARRNIYPRGSGGQSTNAAILLPKRRSRDENGLSKEEIEASLNEADKYWRRNYGELSDAHDNKMTDSTYSSGSGEEMARSDSNHELVESPMNQAKKKKVPTATLR